MRFLIDIGIALVIATALGFSTAWYAIDHGPVFGSVAIRGWAARPLTGSPDADPYSVAMLARTGEVPLGAGEGLSFTAEVDDEGRPLTGRCSYHVVGQTPATRLWTLSAYDGDGRLMINAARRSGFHSREIVRDPDGSFDVAISTGVRPGNWLPIASADRFKLVLRLYDTPLTTGGTLTDLEMPRILRGACT